MPADTYPAALAAFQAEIPRIHKNSAAIVPTKAGGTYGYKYADLAAITAIALPLLGKHGLSFTASPRLTGNGFVLHYELRHISGEGDSGDWPLPDPTRSTPQQVGSAITYARRYCLCAVTGLAPDEEDDDAAAASRDSGDSEYRPETRADGSATEAEQARMNRGPVPGTQRITAAPPDDPFYDTDPAIRPPREQLPGTASQAQLGRMHAQFTRLGLSKDDRDKRLAMTRDIIGRDIQSASALSYVEAQRLNDELDARVKKVTAGA